MIESLKRAWFSLEDRLFDLRHGIDTRHRAADRAAVPADAPGHSPGGGSSGHST